MDYSVREAARGDIPAVQRIERQGYSDPWPGSIFYLLLGRASGLFLVAESGGRIIGYAVGELEEDDDEVLGHVLNLAVAEEWRRRGVGGRLLSDLEGLFMARGVEGCFLEVRVGNAAAQSLYAERGYANKGRLIGYYRSEDGFRMEKRIRR